jgi:hypothetical protein
MTLPENTEPEIMAAPASAPPDGSQAIIKKYFKFLDPSVRDRHTGSIPVTELYDFSKRECIVPAGRTRAGDKATTVYDTIRKLLCDILLETLDEKTFTPEHEKVFTEHKRGLHLSLGLHHTDNPDQWYNVQAPFANSIVKGFLEKHSGATDVFWLIVEHTNLPQDLGNQRRTHEHDGETQTVARAEKGPAVLFAKGPPMSKAAPGLDTQPADLLSDTGDADGQTGTYAARKVAARDPFSLPTNERIGLTAFRPIPVGAVAAHAERGIAMNDSPSPTLRPGAAMGARADGDGIARGTNDDVTAAGRRSRLFPDANPDNILQSPEERAHMMQSVYGP